jgi:hypothetical protein
MRRRLSGCGGKEAGGGGRLIRSVSSGNFHDRCIALHCVAFKYAKSLASIHPPCTMPDTQRPHQNTPLQTTVPPTIQAGHQTPQTTLSQLHQHSSQTLVPIPPQTHSISSAHRRKSRENHILHNNQDFRLCLTHESQRRGEQADDER